MIVSQPPSPATTWIGSATATNAGLPGESAVEHDRKRHPEKHRGAAHASPTATKRAVGGKGPAAHSVIARFQTMSAETAASDDGCEGQQRQCRN